MFLVFSLVQNGSASLRKAITVMGDSIITVELKHTPIQTEKHLIKYKNPIYATYFACPLSSTIGGHAITKKWFYMYYT